MAIAFVKAFYDEDNVITIPAGGIAQGNFLVLGFLHDDNTNAVTAINDTAGNTYAQAVINDDNAANRHVAIWYAYMTTGLSAGNTITLTQVASHAGCIVGEFSGITSVTPLDKTQQGDTVSGTSHTTGLTASTAQADELLIGVHGTMAGTAAFTNTGSWIRDAAMTQTPFGVYRVSMQYQIVSSVGTYESTGTTAGATAYGQVIATFEGGEVIPTPLQSGDVHSGRFGPF